jgi:hypothetical protein
MQKNIHLTNISGLFNPEIILNYASNTTCFNPNTIYDSPFAQILHADNHWVTVTNHNSFYEEEQQQHKYKWFYFDSFN